MLCHDAMPASARSSCCVTTRCRRARGPRVVSRRDGGERGVLVLCHDAMAASAGSSCCVTTRWRRARGPRVVSRRDAGERGVLVLTRDEHISELVQQREELGPPHVLIVHDLLQVVLAVKVWAQSEI